MVLKQLLDVPGEHNYFNLPSAFWSQHSVERGREEGGGDPSLITECGYPLSCVTLKAEQQPEESTVKLSVGKEWRKVFFSSALQDSVFWDLVLLVCPLFMFPKAPLSQVYHSIHTVKLTLLKSFLVSPPKTKNKTQKIKTFSSSAALST